MRVAGKAPRRQKYARRVTSNVGNEFKARSLSRGVLPLLRSITRGKTDHDIDDIEPSVVHHALDQGLGAVLAYITADARRSVNAWCADRIRSADLTARLLTGDKCDVLVDILAAAESVGCRPVLLKGVSTALRYYPAPHLRTMGDIDVLVPADYQTALEARLRKIGFSQSSDGPPDEFVNRHHSMPFVHRERRVWIDVHTKVIPRQYPLAGAALFSPAAVASQLSEIKIGNRCAYVMTHELQLLYTSVRWLERFDPHRGVFPILDAALLVERHGDMLDWDWICASVKQSWATTSLHLILSYISRSELARVPGDVLAWLTANDPYSTWASRILLHQCVTTYVMEPRPPSEVFTTNGAAIVWRTLVRPASPWINLVSVPYHVVFPPHVTARFSPSYAWRRAQSLVGRVRGRFFGVTSVRSGTIWAMTQSGDSPGVRFPPPLIYTLAIIGGWIAHRRWPLRVGFPIPREIVAAGLIVVCTVLCAYAIGLFRRSHTSPIPIRPATALVTWGPYRFTRNPMYVALAGFTIAAGLLMNTWWPVVLLVPTLLIVQRFVIVPEERYLRRHFGEEYDVYARRVRRWL